MTKHTAAPWIVDVCTHVIFVYHNNGEKNPYKIISGISIEQPNSLADAKLIAAAPEMLQALHVALKLSDDYIDEDLGTGYARERSPECQAIYDQVKAAINKATI